MGAPLEGVGVEPVRDVIIVGGGPAGSAAAIQLAKNGLAGGTLLLDAAAFPREKLCGGGLVPGAEQLLGHLGLGTLQVPSISIRRIRVEYEGGSHVQPGGHMFRVVRREDFDHALLSEAKASGVSVREAEPVLRLQREREAVCLETPAGHYRARVVIGADGANSRVRRSLVGPTRGPRMLALEVLTADVSEEAAHEAVFDFRPCAAGLRGYAWDFPSVRAGKLLMNRGIGGSLWPTGVSARELFRESLARRGLDLSRLELEGWSAPAYDPDSSQGAERVLLAGDAVGVDSWLGEGITSAIGSGMLAAHVASDAISSGRFDFSDHHERLRESGVGWQLLRNAAIAEPFYEAAAKPRGLEVLLSGAGQ